MFFIAVDTLEVGAWSAFWDINAVFAFLAMVAFGVATTTASAALPLALAFAGLFHMAEAPAACALAETWFINPFFDFAGCSEHEELADFQKGS
jgi:hypothetical protein